MATISWGWRWTFTSWARSRLLRDVTVTRTDSPDNILAVTASARTGATTDEIERELVRIWREEVRYRYREACTTTSDETQVRLDGVTQVGPGAFFVTASVTVRR